MSAADQRRTPGGILPGVPDADTNAWTTATRSAPMTFQVVLAAMFGVAWLLDRGPLHRVVEFTALLLIASVITALVTLVIGVAALSSESAHRRGTGLAIAGSGMAMLAGVFGYDLVMVLVMEHLQ